MNLGMPNQDVTFPPPFLDAGCTFSIQVSAKKKNV